MFPHSSIFAYRKHIFLEFDHTIDSFYSIIGEKESMELLLISKNSCDVVLHIFVSWFSMGMVS